MAKNKIFQGLFFAWLTYQLFVYFFGHVDVWNFRLGHVFFATLAIFILTFFSDNRDWFTKVSACLVLLGIFGAITFTNQAWVGVFAAAGCIGIIGVANNVVSRPASILTACLGALAIIYTIGQGTNIIQLVTAIWSGPQGIFGDAISVSIKYVFWFVILGALFDRLKVTENLFKIGIRIGKSTSSVRQIILALTSIGTVKGVASSAVKSIRRAHKETEENSSLPKSERSGFMAISSVQSQFLPPIMGTAAFLASEHSGITYGAIVGNSLIAALLITFSLYYFCTSREKFYDHVDTVIEFKELGLSLLKNFLIVIAIALFSYLALFFLNGISFDFNELYLLVPALVLYALPAVFSKSSGQNENVEFHKLIPFILLAFFLFLHTNTVSDALICMTLFCGAAFTLEFLVRPSNTANNEELETAEGFAVEALKLLSSITLTLALAGLIVSPIFYLQWGDFILAAFDAISFGNLYIVLLLTALLCVIFGLAFPVSATFILVSAIAIPQMASASVAAGVIIPMISLTLFVMFLAIYADLTPPDEVANSVSANITGVAIGDVRQSALRFSVPIIIVPFLFVLEPNLLLLETTSLGEFLGAVAYSFCGLTLFSHFMTNTLFLPLVWWEKLLLALAITAFLVPSHLVEQSFKTSDVVRGEAFENYLSQTTPLEQVTFIARSPANKEKTVTVSGTFEDGPNLLKRFLMSGLIVSKPSIQKFLVMAIDQEGQFANSPLRKGWVIEGVVAERIFMTKLQVSLFSILIVFVLVGSQLMRLKSQANTRSAI